MSWKMFGQIVLLIIIAVVILGVARAVKYSVCGIGKMKPTPAMSQYSRNFGPSKAPMEKSK